MSENPQFKAAYPYQEDVLALPVVDLDEASAWYCKHFSMKEVQRLDTPNPTVILERDGVKIGFAINGGDAPQDGAAVLVVDIQGMKEELEANGLNIGDLQIDERDGKKFQAFFVVAPDGLCYYFHEEIGELIDSIYLLRQ
ncbi:MAG: VOC family protein [Lentisphaeria bacterium]|nr:VOC family protein [Lentisphaeria bacterium]NQZ66596.1 VOC family protein [Lentisphaeria bacterium]